MEEEEQPPPRYGVSIDLKGYLYGARWRFNLQSKQQEQKLWGELHLFIIRKLEEYGQRYDEPFPPDL